MKKLIPCFFLFVSFLSDLQVLTAQSGLYCNSYLSPFVPETSDPVMYVNVAVTRLRPSSGTGAWDNVTLSDVLSWINSANDWYNNVVAPTVTMTGVPYIQHTKIQFVLMDGTAFFDAVSDNAYHSSAYADQYLHVANAANIYLIEDNARFVPIPVPGPYVSFGDKGSTNVTDAGCAHDLAHELGHYLGLTHAVDRNVTGGDEGPPRINFNFGSNCSCGNAAAIDFVESLESNYFQTCNTVPTPPNNLMTQNAGCYDYLSPHQMAIMRYHLLTDYMSNLTYTSYLNVTEVDHSFDQSITGGGTTTWNTPHYMRGNLTVTAGNTLKVQCLIAMTHDSKIIVEPGAKLWLDGGTVTNLSGRLWGGIDVQGSSGLAQTSTYQGVLEMYGATVSNAYTAVRNYGYYSNGSIDYSSTGGIINATSSSFLNNIRDVEFLATPITINSASRFYGCDFKTTAAIKDGTTSLAPYVHISLWSVKGVEVNGCVFENAAQATYPYTGEGVHGIDAIYAFDDWNNVHNEFKGFDKAISVNNINAQRLVNVYATNFNDNKQGIVFANMESANIEDNLFALKAAGSIGISFNYNKYYRVANNTFYEINTTNSWKAGIYASYSGDGAHRIYRNNFSGMYMGIAPQFNNSGPTNITDGLYMNCNDFTIGTPNTWDIAMLGNSTNSNVMPTVAQDQGIITYPNLNPKKLVRNQYGSACVTGGMRKWYVALGSTKGIEHAANSNTVTQPTPQSACSSTLLNISNSGWAFNYSSDCQSTGNRPVTDPDCPCRNCCLYDDISAGLSEALNKTATLSAYVTGTIDAGSTIDLVNNMNNSGLSVAQKMALLVAASPYVSDEALIAFIEQSAVVGGDVIAIHDLNKPVTQAVWDAIERKGFSGGTMATLEDQQDDEPMSARRALEGELNLVKADLQFIYSEKLNYFLNDTLDHSHDTVIKLLSENLGGLPDAPVQLINAYANAGQYEDAFDQVESLGSDPDYTELMTLYHTLLVLDTSEKKIFYALENNDLKNILEEYADDSTMAGSSLARAVLNTIEDRPMNFQYLLPEDAPGERMMGQLSQEEESSQSAATETPSALFRLYPNPAATAFIWVILYRKKNCLKFLLC